MQQHPQWLLFKHQRYSIPDRTKTISTGIVKYSARSKTTLGQETSPKESSLSSYVDGSLSVSMSFQC